MGYWDSGSNISIVSYNHFSKLYETDRFKSVIKVPNINVTSVTGENLKLIGKVSLYFSIGKIKFIHEVYILDDTKFVGDILIGRDIIKRIGKVMFNFEEKYIQINKVRLPIVCSSDYDIQCFSVSKVKLNEDKLKLNKRLVLPPRSFVKTHGIVGKKWKNKHVVIESSCTDGLRVGNTLAIVNDKLEVPFTIANYFDREITLNKNELIGDIFLAAEEERNRDRKCSKI